MLLENLISSWSWSTGSGAWIAVAACSDWPGKALAKLVAGVSEDHILPARVERGSRGLLALCMCLEQVAVHTK